VDPNDIPTTITRLVYDAPRIQTSDGNTLKISQNQAARMLAHYWWAIERHIRSGIGDDISAAVDRLIPEDPDDRESVEAMSIRKLGLRNAERIARRESLGEAIDRANGRWNEEEQQ
jgi:hypothetical protein